MIDNLKIGSIVTIKNEIKKVMIIGYSEGKYLGVIFPLGYINKDQTISFISEDIIKIYSIGFQEG